MKNKMFFLMVIFIILSWNKLSATVYHKYLDNTNNSEMLTICGGINDTVIVHKPSSATTQITWFDPSFQMIIAQDTVIVTYSTQGNWTFSSTQIGKDFYVFFISTQPYQPACMSHDSAFCTTTINWTLDAQNTQTYATYQWSTGVTTRTFVATAPGTYAVTVTNACGVGIYSINITQGNPNAPHLGPDKTICWGSSALLNPGSTNVTSYLWSTGATTSTLSVDTTGSYWVYVQDGNGCSGRDTINIVASLPIAAPICFVEFDTTSWKNEVNWTSNLPANADSVHIYKETSLNVWTKIGSVPKTVNHFLDMASAPQSQSYYYRIAVVDTCGNESDLSSYHKTITLLSAYDAPTHTYGFNWSPYEGLTVSDYYLFGIDSSNAVTQIASVPGNIYMYNYLYPNPGFVKYYIGFESPSCDTKTNVIVKSNWVTKDSSLTRVQEVFMSNLSVYPNPANDQLNINIDLNDFQVEVLTMLGQVVLTEHNAKVLNVGDLSPGTYIVSVIVDDKRSNRIFTKN